MDNAALIERLTLAGHFIKWAKDAMHTRIERKGLQITETEQETSVRYDNALEGLREAIRRLSEKEDRIDG